MKQPDADKWKIAVKEEYDRMMKYKVLIPVPMSEVPRNAKVVTSAWAMKKKAKRNLQSYNEP